MNAYSWRRAQPDTFWSLENGACPDLMDTMNVLVGFELHTADVAKGGLRSGHLKFRHNT
jgi:hypothetical protein